MFIKTLSVTSFEFLLSIKTVVEAPVKTEENIRRNSGKVEVIPAKKIIRDLNSDSN